MRSCSVSGCDIKKRRGVRIFMFPKIYYQTETFKKLSTQRQFAWLSALGKADVDPNSYRRIFVCDGHFVSGKCASLQDINNVDWVPNLNLQNPIYRSTEILRCSVDDCLVSNEGGPCNFYRVPKINERGELKELSEQKLSSWISALGIRNDESTVHENVYVCQSHYISEMSGKLRDTSNNEVNSFDCDSTETFEIDFDTHDLNTVQTTRKELAPKQPLSTTKKKVPKSFKSGEIFRDENGEFSFVCSYCKVVCEECQQMIDHINAHFGENDKNKFEMSIASQHSPEFVSCPTDFKMESEEFTNTIPSSEPSNNSGVRWCTMKLIKSKPSRPLKRCFDELQKSNTEDAPRLWKTSKLKLLTQPFDTVTQSPKPPSAVRCVVKNNESNYKIKNSNVYLTSSKDLGKRKDTIDQDTLKCYQCKLAPAVSDSDPRPHKCKECDKWLPNHIAYKNHFLEEHHLLRSIKCYQCDMEPSINNVSDPRRHKCVFCKEWFPNHTEFVTHLKDEHDKNLDIDHNSEHKEYTCYICERSLKQREYLVYHIKCHFEKHLKYQCHICGLRVVTERILKEHMKKHEEKPSKCDLCSMVFPNYLRMRNHRLRHTSNLKYCNVCSKGFKMSQYLKSHMAVHNDVKICCRYCDASFKFSTGRRAHEKSVHNVV